MYYINRITGWSGMLYGKSSLVIKDSKGKVRIHTGSRKINTIEELETLVNNAEMFLDDLVEALKEVKD